MSRRRSRSPDHAEHGHFTLLFTAKRCSKIYNVRAQPLFWSLNLLFGGGPRCRRRGGLLKLPNVEQHGYLLIWQKELAALRSANVFYFSYRIKPHRVI